VNRHMANECKDTVVCLRLNLDGNDIIECLKSTNGLPQNLVDECKNVRNDKINKTFLGVTIQLFKVVKKKEECVHLFFVAADFASEKQFFNHIFNVLRSIGDLLSFYKKDSNILLPNDFLKTC